LKDKNLEEKKFADKKNGRPLEVIARADNLIFS